MSAVLTLQTGMIGAVVFKAGPTVPTGFLAANGQAVSRATYAALFAELGTAWGTGDGTTTFNLPDLRGRVPVAAGQGTGLTDRVLATVGGAENVTLSINEMPLHGHPVRRANVAQSSAASQTSGGYLTNTTSNVNDPAHTGTPSATAGDQIGGSGGGQAHNNMPPFGVLHAFIRF
jgi:microcystin-dependent protein